MPDDFGAQMPSLADFTVSCRNDNPVGNGLQFLARGFCPPVIFPVLLQWGGGWKNRVIRDREI
jgi:hypothetical protein